MKDKKLEFVTIRLIKDRTFFSEKEITDSYKAVQLVKDYIVDSNKEMLCSLNMDSKGRVINGSVVSIGTINQTMVSPSEIIKIALLSNAASIILMHNHPSGNIEPSLNDISVTRRMIEATNLLDITFNDHIIVGSKNENYYSFREKRGDLWESLKFDFLKCNDSDSNNQIEMLDNWIEENYER